LRSPIAPLLLLIGVFALSLLLRGNVWNGEGIDECYYYAQATSPLWDADQDYTNDLLESRNGYELRLELGNRLFHNGLVDMPFSAGLAVLNGPALAATRLLDTLSHGRLGALDRYAYVYRAIQTLGTWLLVLLGLVAAQRAGARYATEWRSTLLCLVLFLGTNLCFYTWHAAAMAHGASFGMGALFLLATIRYLEAPTRRRAALVGIAWGLCFLIRWQDALVGIVLLAGLLGRARADATWRANRERRVERILLLAAAIATAAPQFALWRAIYGEWLVIPQGGGFFILAAGRLRDVLFSPLNGWIYTHPVLALFLASFVVLASRRDAILTGCLLLVLAAIVVNSLPGDWWAGGSFGNRRFIGIYPFLVPAAAASFNRAGRGPALLFLAAATLLSTLNLLLVIRFAQHAVQPVFWGSTIARLHDLLAFPLHGSGALLSSDLFTPPIAVDNLRRTRTLFLLLIGTVLALGNLLVQHRRRPLRPPASALALSIVLYTLFLSPFLLACTIPGRDRLSAWNEEIMPDLLRDARESLRGKADAQPPGRADLLMVRLYRLESALADKRWDDADNLTRTLRPLAPRSVLDAWQRLTPPHRPNRQQVIAELLARPDPPRETLLRLYNETTRLQQQPALRALRARIAGPGWLREQLRYREEFDSGQKTATLRRRLDAALNADPFAREPLTDLLSLERHGERLPALAARHHALLTGDLELADYVRQHFPDQSPVFEPLWRQAIIDHFYYLEQQANARHAGDALALAADLGLRNLDLDYWRKRFAKAALYEQRLLGHPVPEFPSGTPTKAVAFPPNAIARATPQWLRDEDGWGGLEVDKATSRKLALEHGLDGVHHSRQAPCSPDLTTSSVKVLGLAETSSSPRPRSTSSAPTTSSASSSGTPTSSSSSPSPSPNASPTPSSASITPPSPFRTTSPAPRTTAASA
jgi:hypothetical protein